MKVLAYDKYVPADEIGGVAPSPSTASSVLPQVES